MDSTSNTDCVVQSFTFLSSSEAVPHNSPSFFATSFGLISGLSFFNCSRLASQKNMKEFFERLGPSFLDLDFFLISLDAARLSVDGGGVEGVDRLDGIRKIIGDGLMLLI